MTRLFSAFLIIFFILKSLGCFGYGYHLDGELRYSSSGINKTNLFSVIVLNNKYRIQSTSVEGNGDYISGTDGKDSYTARWTKVEQQGKIVDKELGYVSSGVYPSDGCESGEIIWMALASGNFFEDANGESIPLNLFVDQYGLGQRDLYMSITQFNDASKLPRNISERGPNYYIKNATKQYFVSKDSDTHLEMNYNVIGQTNSGGLTIPIHSEADFEYIWYTMTGNKGSSQFAHYELSVTNINFKVEDDDLLPPIRSSRINVIDRRFQGKNGQAYKYVILDKMWLSRNQVNQLIKNGGPLATETELRGKANIVVLIFLLLTFVPLTWFIWTKKEKNKNIKDNK
jgi:hypothetical protein